MVIFLAVVLKLPLLLVLWAIWYGGQAGRQGGDRRLPCASQRMALCGYCGHRIAVGYDAAEMHREAPRSPRRTGRGAVRRRDAADPRASWRSPTASPSSRRAARAAARPRHGPRSRRWTTRLGRAGVGAAVGPELGLGARIAPGGALRRAPGRRAAAGASSRSATSGPAVVLAEPCSLGDAGEQPIEWRSASSMVGDLAADAVAAVDGGDQRDHAGLEPHRPVGSSADDLDHVAGTGSARSVMKATPVRETSASRTSSMLAAGDLPP